MGKTTYIKTEHTSTTSAPPYNDAPIKTRLAALESKIDKDSQTLSLNDNNLTISGGNTITLPFATIEVGAEQGLSVTKSGNRYTLSGKSLLDRITALEGRPTATPYNDTDIKKRLTTLEGKVDNDKQQLSLNTNTRVLSISNGNSVTLPSDKQTITKEGNKLILSNGGGEITLPQPTNVTAYDDTALVKRVKVLEDKPDKDTVYNDTNIKQRLSVLEAKRDNDNQTLSVSGNSLSISGGNSVKIPQPDLSDYVPVAEYNKLKVALEQLLIDLIISGAWVQTGSTVFEGALYPNRHIATGNINLFGGSVDGNSFIRTNNNRTENDLAGGI